MLWILLFALFWIVEFTIAMMRFIIGCTVCMWYYSDSDSDGIKSNNKTSIWTATKWGFFYHMGSIAMGAFLLAVVKMIKAIFEYVT